MSLSPARAVWLLIVTMLPIGGCILVQPLDNATPDDDSSSTAGSSSSTAGAKGTAGKPSGSSGATGGAGRPGAGSGAGGAPVTGNARFLGGWTATEGMLTFSCPGVADMSQDVTGYAETWEVGTSSALVQPQFEGTCPLNANVSGTTATAVPGQSCTESDTAANGDSTTQTLAFTTYRFVIDAAGETATETFSGTDVYKDNTTNQTLPCTFSRNAKFSKD